jgi:hypothetical protein
MSWIIDDFNEQGYLTTCKEAAADDHVFSTFRRNRFFGLIVENSPLKSGLEYYDCIQSKFPWLLTHMDRFILSDNIGSPQRYAIGNWFISPSTMRYIKTLGDLTNLFGSLDGKNIAEIGPGYGGLCKIIHDVYKPQTYSLFDQLDPSMLQCKFLNHFKVDNLLFPYLSQTKEFEFNFDLCIAMYSWSELSRDHQVEYMNKVMKRSKNLYIMLNYDMDFSYNLIKENFPAECISDYNLFYDDANMEYYPHNRFIIVKQ